MERIVDEHILSRQSRGRCLLFAWIRFGVVGAAVCALYGAVLRDLILTWWNDSAASYGMLIPFLAVYTAWMRRRATLNLLSAPSNAGLPIVLSACGLLLIGHIGAEFYLSRVSFVVLLAGFTATFWGFPRLQSLTFPLVLLWTMVPLPAILYNSLSAPLQLVASGAATSVCEWLGLTVYRDGNIIHLADTALGVAEACSGLQSLASLVVGAMLLGYIECARLSLRFALAVLAVPLSIAVNILRVTVTAVLADYDLAFAEGFYHVFSGWVMFALGLLLLWCLARGLHWVEGRWR